VISIAVYQTGKCMCRKFGEDSVYFVSISFGQKSLGHRIVSVHRQKNENETAGLILQFWVEFFPNMKAPSGQRERCFVSTQHLKK
jgi:hypothetical protein